MKIKPLGENVLIRIEIKDKTKGGIIIPDEAQIRPQIGKVVDIGDKVQNIHIGDIVCFPVYIGNLTPEKNLILVNYEDILARIEECDEEILAKII